MKILFVHQNFPGQFLHLAPALQARGHECRALTDANNTRESAIPVLRYRHNAALPDPAATRLGRNFTQMTDRGVTAARACLLLRDKHGYTPDVIVGHSGWGETLFLKEVWPSAKLIVYAEFYYRGVDRDVGFDPEFSRDGFDPVMTAQARAAHLGQSLLHADAGLAPTKWQASTYPPVLQPLIKVIFDGVNTAVMAPNADASLTLPGGQTLHAGDEVLTFVNRNLEPYRGYHTFMRALPDVMAARPNAQVVIVGGDEVSYGAAAPNGKTWKDIFLDEVRDRLDESRVHFIGKVPYAQFVALMQISRAHAYLTYPFVLSWSALEAMAAGCLLVGSDTAPVREVVEDGVNGFLTDFFDHHALARRIAETLAHRHALERMRRAARETVLSRYDKKRVCLPAHARLAEQVLAGGCDAKT